MKTKITTCLTGLAMFSFCFQAKADLQQGAAAAAQAAMPIAMMAAVSSGATATALKFPCTASPPNPLACAMMGLAIVQVGMALAQKSGSKDSANSLTDVGGSYAGTDGVTNADPNSTYTTPNGTTVNGDYAQNAKTLAANGLGGLANDYANSVGALKKSGVTVSPDGKSVTMPDGKKVDSSAFGSPDGMQGAGFSGADIAGAENALKGVPAILASLKVKPMTNDVAGGGGGGLRGGGGSDGSSGASLAGFGKMPLGKKDVSVAGMSKKFGNDNIGVAGDNIFEMVTRRYQARDKVDTFLKK